MLPQVAIVGRPNVGKSSLLNMLAGRRVSIVDDQPGVTRDRVGIQLELPPVEPGGAAGYCELIDTGGYGIYEGDEQWSALTDDVERQIEFAVEHADLILFVVDGRVGITPLDEQVAERLRRRVGDTSRIILLANKVDHPKHEADAMEALSLGLGEPTMTSTTTGTGKIALLETLAERLAGRGDQPPAESEMLLAIVGKRNAGKSTLVNTLVGSQRVIVSDLEGTTRDSVDVRFEMDGRAFTAIDTAGARRRKSVREDVEYYSLHRSLRSIRRADVVLLMIDATLPISQVEKKLSQEITEHYRPCLIVLNKWDLVEDELSAEDYQKYLDQELRGLTHAPVATVSAKTGEGVREAVQTAWELREQAHKRISTGALNRALQDVLGQRGPSGRLGGEAKVYYATQVSVDPPTIAVFVNDPRLFDQQYRRYLLNGLRERLGFDEVPVKLFIRARRREDRHTEPIRHT